MSQAIIGTFLNWLATGLTIEEGFRSITHDGSKAISDRDILHLSEVVDYEDVPDDIEMYVSKADEYIAQYHNELHETILTSEHRNHFIETFYKTHPDCRIHRSITDYYLNNYLDRLEAALKSGTTLYDLFISKQISCVQETANDIKKTVNAIKDRQNITETDFYRRMMDSFTYEREQHPSIRMMKPDPDLFPKGLPEILSDRRYATEKDKPPRAIKEMILESWKRQERKHILLIGEGGIGKTVAMLTLPEEDWFKKFEIPAIYVPLQRLDKYEGDLNRYLEVKFGLDSYNRIIDLANHISKGHPRMLLLLDGFNEIPDIYKKNTGKYIREWMERPGVQIITTSRLGFFLENRCTRYRLQVLPFNAVKSFLLSAGIKEESLPSENDRISKVINVPLMLTIYTQIEKVREVADCSSETIVLDWKKPDNAAHIIWDYLQMELYRCIERDDTSHSVMQYAIALLAVAPYICCQMSRQTKFYIKQGEFIKLIREALVYYDSHQDLLSSQILNVREAFDPYHEEDLLQEAEAAEYARILIDNTALFRRQIVREKGNENEDVIDYSCSLMHQNFRDALAAFFISSCLPKTSGSKEKKALLDYSDYYVKNYMAEHLSSQELVSMWDRHRKEEPEDGHITWILLDIIGRQRNYDYRELNFSGVDLTKTNLHRLLSKRQNICPLPSDCKNLDGTKISIECLSPSGHTNCITCIAYSPDGRYIASGAKTEIVNGPDVRTVQIWNLESGESRILEDCFSEVRSVTFSPDGKSLAIGLEYAEVRVWNLETGKTRILEGTLGGFNSVTYSPDERHLASGADDGTVWIWDLESEESSVLQEHEHCVESVAYSPDGKHLASGSRDGTIRIRNLETGKSRMLEDGTIGNQDDDEDWVWCVAYSPDGNYLASSASGGLVKIWDLKTGENYVLKGHKGRVFSVEFSLDGRFLVSGASDGSVRIWNLENRESKILDDHAGWVRSVKYSPDGRQLTSCASNSRIVRLWDLESEEQSLLYGLGGEVISIVYSPDGKHLAGGIEDSTVRIWDLESGESRVLEGHTKKVNSVAYSSEGYLASCSDDGTVRTWDLERGESYLLRCSTNEYDKDRGHCYCVSYSPNGKFLANGASYGIIWIWDLESGESRLLKGYNRGAVESIAFSPDGKHLASVGQDSLVRIWDLESGESRVLQGQTGIIKSVVYSQDGRLIASGSDDGTVRIWDLKSGNVLNGDFNGVSCLAFSPDGKRLANSAGVFRRKDWKVLICDLETRESSVLEGYGGKVNSIAFSPDGQHLASGSSDRMVRIWDLEEYKEVRKFSIIPRLNLSGANFELAIIPEKEKEYLEMVGAKCSKIAKRIDQTHQSHRSSFCSFCNRSKYMVHYLITGPNGHNICDDCIGICCDILKEKVSIKMRSSENRHCSFCNKPESILKRLISGPEGVYICNECVDICRDILRTKDED